MAAELGNGSTGVPNPSGVSGPLGPGGGSLGSPETPGVPQLQDKLPVQRPGNPQQPDRQAGPPGPLAPGLRYIRAARAAETLPAMIDASSESPTEYRDPRGISEDVKGFVFDPFRFVEGKWQPVNPGNPTLYDTVKILVDSDSGHYVVAGVRQSEQGTELMDILNPDQTRNLAHDLENIDGISGGVIRGKRFGDRTTFAFDVENETVSAAPEEEGESSRIETASLMPKNIEKGIILSGLNTSAFGILGQPFDTCVKPAFEAKYREYMAERENMPGLHEGWVFGSQEDGDLITTRGAISSSVLFPSIYGVFDEKSGRTAVVGRPESGDATFVLDNSYQPVAQLRDIFGDRQDDLATFPLPKEGFTGADVKAIIKRNTKSTNAPEPVLAARDILHKRHMQKKLAAAELERRELDPRLLPQEYTIPDVHDPASIFPKVKQENGRYMLEEPPPGHEQYSYDSIMWVFDQDTGCIMPMGVTEAVPKFVAMNPRTFAPISPDAFALPSTVFTGGFHEPIGHYMSRYIPTGKVTDAEEGGNAFHLTHTQYIGRSLVDGTFVEKHSPQKVAEMYHAGPDVRWGFTQPYQDALAYARQRTGERNLGLHLTPEGRSERMQRELEEIRSRYAADRPLVNLSEPLPVLDDAGFDQQGNYVGAGKYYLAADTVTGRYAIIRSFEGTEYVVRPMSLKSWSPGVDEVVGLTYNGVVVQVGDERQYITTAGPDAPIPPTAEKVVRMDITKRLQEGMTGEEIRLYSEALLSGSERQAQLGFSTVYGLPDHIKAVKVPDAQEEVGATEDTFRFPGFVEGEDGKFYARSGSGHGYDSVRVAVNRQGQIALVGWRREGKTQVYEVLGPDLKPLGGITLTQLRYFGDQYIIGKTFDDNQHVKFELEGDHVYSRTILTRRGERPIAGQISGFPILRQSLIDGMRVDQMKEIAAAYEAMPKEKIRMGLWDMHKAIIDMLGPEAFEQRPIEKKSELPESMEFELEKIRKQKQSSNLGLLEKLPPTIASGAEPGNRPDYESLSVITDDRSGYSALVARDRTGKSYLVDWKTLNPVTPGFDLPRYFGGQDIIVERDGIVYAITRGAEYADVPIPTTPSFSGEQITDELGDLDAAGVIRIMSRRREATGNQHYGVAFNWLEGDLSNIKAKAVGELGLPAAVERVRPYEELSIEDKRNALIDVLGTTAALREANETDVVMFTEILSAAIGEYTRDLDVEILGYERLQVGWARTTRHTWDYVRKILSEMQNEQCLPDGPWVMELYDIMKAQFERDEWEDLKRAHALTPVRGKGLVNRITRASAEIRHRMGTEMGPSNMLLGLEQFRRGRLVYPSQEIMTVELPPEEGSESS